METHGFTVEDVETYREAHRLAVQQCMVREATLATLRATLQTIKFADDVTIDRAQTALIDHFDAIKAATLAKVETDKAGAKALKAA